MPHHVNTLARNIDYNTRKARARKKWVQPELATRVPDPGSRSGGKFKSLDGVIVLVLAVQDLVAVEPEPHGQGAPEHCPHGQGEPEPEPPHGVGGQGQVQVPQVPVLGQGVAPEG